MIGDRAGPHVPLQFIKTTTSTEGLINFVWPIETINNPLKGLTHDGGREHRTRTQEETQ